MMFRHTSCDNDELIIEQTIGDAADVAEYVASLGGAYDAVEWSEDGIMLGDNRIAYQVINRADDGAAVNTVWCDGYRVIILTSVIADMQVQIDNLDDDLTNLREEIFE